MEPNQPSTAQGEMPWPDGRVAWYAVGVLTLAYTFSYIDRSILSLLVGPIREDLGISDTQFSLLQGLAFAVFYTVMGIPIARLADRRSRRAIIAVGVFFWSLMTVACGFARGYWQLFAARVGVGVGEAALSPAAYSMIADLFPKERLGRALGIYSVGVFLGIGLSFLIGGAVVSLVSESSAITLPIFGEIRPWQITFFVVGLPGFAVALLILTIKEPVRRKLGGSSVGTSASIAQVLGYARSHWRTYAGHFFGFSMLTLLFNGIVSWTPEFFVRTYGMSRGEIGPILGLIVMTFGSLGIVCGGLMTDAFTKRGFLGAPILAGLIGAFFLVPLAAGATLMPSATLSLALFCPLLFFASFPFGPAAAGIQFITPGDMRAQMSAVYLFVVNLTGIGLGPTITALVTDYVFGDDMMLRYSMSIVGGFGGIAACILLWTSLNPFRATVAAARGESVGNV